MRGLKSIYIPHPSPLPEGEGIFKGSPKYFFSALRVSLSLRRLCR